MQAFISRIIAFIMSILALLGIGVKKDPVPETKDYTSRIDGTKIEILLDANPTTGYNWEYEIDGDSAVFVSEDYKQRPGTEGMGGAGGTDTFVFEAVKPGRSEITFTYLRPWETDGDKTILTLTIDVSDDMSQIKVQ